MRKELTTSRCTGAPPLPVEVEHLVLHRRLLVLHHAGGRQVDQLHVTEEPGEEWQGGDSREEVPVEVHVELAVIVEGEAELLLDGAREVLPLAVPGGEGDGHHGGTALLVGPVALPLPPVPVGVPQPGRGEARRVPT